MKKLLSLLSLDEFSRYLVVGGLAFAIDFLCMAVLTEGTNVNYLLANAIAFCTGLATNYLLSIFWVFKTRVIRSVQKEFLLFSGIGIVNLIIGELFLWVLVEYLHLHPLLGKIAITGLVFLSNFILRKLLLFKEQYA